MHNWLKQQLLTKSSYNIKDLANELLESQATLKTWYSTSEVIQAQLLSVYSRRDNLTSSPWQGRDFYLGKKLLNSKARVNAL